MKKAAGSDWHAVGREARILQELRHPGIPILYDYEEDDAYVYLVEEYVEGVPLSDYLDMRDAISVEQICFFLVQICEIVEYLHNRQPFPILYQDMKPEHLFLCGDRLMLIDYGTALYLPRSGKTFQQYGTPGYCAPEIVASGTTSVQADIFSIGRVAALLLAHTDERIPHRLHRLAGWACCRKPEDRPASIAEYRQAWEKAYKKAQLPKKSSSQATIVVTGISRGCGTTHIAISLTVYLNATGIKAYYIDRTPARTTQQLCSGNPGFLEKDMVIYHHHFRAVLHTGEAVEEAGAEDGVKVIDTGCEWDGFCDADLVICVAGSRPWQENRIDFSQLPKDAVVIVNPMNRYKGRCFARLCGRQVMGFPLDKDPFHLSRKKKELFKGLTGSIDR